MTEGNLLSQSTVLTVTEQGIMPIHEVPIEPLTKAAFRSFGDVIERREESCFETNHGEILRHPDLAQLNLTADGGRPSISIFQVRRPAVFPLRLRLMERHPISTQAFIPIDRCEYLVVVAHRNADLKSSELRAFVAQSGQGINLYAGVWHHPLIALGTSDFVVIDRTISGDPSEQDCEEIPLDGEFVIAAPSPTQWSSA